MSRPRIILASRSPRRAELLTAMGLVFEVRAADIDESRRGREAPEDYVVRLALGKAQAVAAPGRLVIGADTAVVLDEQILGKPADRAHGAAMLMALQGRTHRVMTGVAVVGAQQARTCCVVTEVTFRAVDRREAEAYAATGEGADKAGGYGIQGIGGIFAEGIRGSYSAVVGLPLLETEQLLREAGLDTWRERRHD